MVQKPACRHVGWQSVWWSVFYQQAHEHPQWTDQKQKGRLQSQLNLGHLGSQPASAVLLLSWNCAVGAVAVVAQLMWVNRDRILLWCHISGVCLLWGITEPARGRCSLRWSANCLCCVAQIP